MNVARTQMDAFFCWELVESTLVRLAANLISSCEENSAMFWVVSVCPMTVMNVNTNPKWGPAALYVFIMHRRQVKTWCAVAALAVDQFISCSWIKQSIAFTSQQLWWPATVQSCPHACYIWPTCHLRIPTMSWTIMHSYKWPLVSFSPTVSMDGVTQWRTLEFCSGGWGVQQIQLRTERTGIWRL